MRGLQESCESSWLNHASGAFTVLKAATFRSEIQLKQWRLADGQQATKPVFCSEDR